MMNSRIFPLSEGNLSKGKNRLLQILARVIAKSLISCSILAMTCYGLHKIWKASKEEQRTQKHKFQKLLRKAESTNPRSPCVSIDIHDRKTQDTNECEPLLWKLRWKFENFPTTSTYGRYYCLRGRLTFLLQSTSSAKTPETINFFVGEKLRNPCPPRGWSG